MKHEYFVYILTNNSGTLYIGMTNNLIRRIYEHRNGFVEGFTKRYKIKKLIYYESTSNVNSAIAREKELKGWVRRKKLELIQCMNPDTKDLYSKLVEDSSS